MVTNTNGLLRMTCNKKNCKHKMSVTGKIKIQLYDVTNKWIWHVYLLIQKQKYSFMLRKFSIWNLTMGFWLRIYDSEIKKKWPTKSGRSNWTISNWKWTLFWMHIASYLLIMWQVQLMTSSWITWIHSLCITACVCCNAKLCNAKHKGTYYKLWNEHA